MEKEEKKAFILLKSLIFHYHGLDEEEEKILLETANIYKAHEELLWANEYIAQDFMTAFDRSRDYLKKVIGSLPTDKKVTYLLSVWNDNNKKGYLTEMEATAMIKLAKDWSIENELMVKIRQS